MIPMKDRMMGEDVSDSWLILRAGMTSEEMCDRRDLAAKYIARAFCAGVPPLPKMLDAFVRFDNELHYPAGESWFAAQTHRSELV